MRRSVSVLLVVSLFACSASAAPHEVHVQVLSVMSQTGRGYSVAGLGAGGSPTLIACTPPFYPSDTVGVISGQGAADQCIRANPAYAVTGSVQNRRVEAILTTEDGRTYYVVLGCQKVYGWCAPLADQAHYVGKLNDKPKWLADYENRPFYGFVKVSLRPDGKKKVTYEIQYATKLTTLIDF
jgi:hypothetical protein